MRWASVWLSLSALPGTASLGFRDASTGVRTSFAANEGVFVLLLRGLGWPSLEALFCALVFAAGQTFLLSRFWAFRR